MAADRTDAVALHGLLIGLAAGVGHMFPVFAGFKGGKGVATNFGIIWGYTWYFALTWFAIFLGIIKVTKYVSLASLSTIFGIGITLFFTKEFSTLELVIYYGYVALVWFMHRGNIKRLLNGTERKVGQNKEKVK
jgi:glycerol-3-phosphate acyltransferase PlsY